MIAENTLTGNSSLVDSGFASPPENPMGLFASWVRQVEKIPVQELYGFVLSTVDHQGAPSSRTLLMKSFDDKGVVFCTNSLSQKGLEMEGSQCVAGTFWWKETLQQINFKGFITQLSAQDSEELFQGRTRSAQVIATLSNQSQPLLDAVNLKEKVRAMAESDEIIPRPENWFGYHCAFSEVEFWVGRKDRFHDRLKYVQERGAWKNLRLQP